MTSKDPFDLERFVTAQDGVFDIALAELHAGCKMSHWMWFVFPQQGGLGRSMRAQFYELASLDEAKAYLAHPLLAQRLISATQAVLAHPHLTAYAIFSTPDDMKFHASMTVFSRASADACSPFRHAIDVFFGGVEHAPTVELLSV
ncbi:MULTISPECIES: DUF1810 domain-containing protein [unclassified Chelatococcus]|uniref:DUF1810 domain-containing protein n=1 Tax=unclassified Chelatococcus TaxID=2638111 RepID=UPI001BD04245|nr:MULTISPECIES: DUF1810 domain-containing protein [unclassified Chelatococcus]MBS7701124.1 DUF1810 domain-containing protein [Chelatococcus sp. YT9]MBX3557255.1 DUF1810 domain-containing protein [Chelatococcus sp.]